MPTQEAEIAVELFILNSRKEEQFILKTDNHKLWLEVSVITLLGVVATVDVHTASNNDVKLVETGTVLFVGLLNRPPVLRE